MPTGVTLLAYLGAGYVAADLWLTRPRRSSAAARWGSQGREQAATFAAAVILTVVVQGRLLG